jgi:hypothetical protein
MESQAGCRIATRARWCTEAPHSRLGEVRIHVLVHRTSRLLRAGTRANADGMRLTTKLSHTRGIGALGPRPFPGSPRRCGRSPWPLGHWPAQRALVSTSLNSGFRTTHHREPTDCSTSIRKWLCDCGHSLRYIAEASDAFECCHLPDHDLLLAAEGSSEHSPGRGPCRGSPRPRHGASARGLRAQTLQLPERHPSSDA